MTYPPFRRLLVPIALSCAAIALPASASAAAPCANANLVPTAANGPQVRAATLCLINRERTSRGLRALRHDGQLRKVAQSYSGLMVRDSFFDHVGSDGSTVLSRIKGRTTYLKRVARWSVGENLYWGSGQQGTPQASVRGWLNSPPHRHNMLNPRFRDIGIGIALGAPEDVAGAPAATYTTEFGTRSSR
jgi:uncharacterized protein YkwD